jgi:enoyl-CoA hydratase/carnithine racemase
MGYEQILTEQRDAVLLLTLNRPERLNAWTAQMMSELTAAITGANADPAVGAIVVTGAGRGFCAGADISATFGSNLEAPPAPAEPPAAERRSDTEGSTGSDWVRFCRASKPLVAAINGPAIGVGLTMVLPFDQLVASREAKLSCRFVKMGLVPELASSHFLVARCGWGPASWLALSGATVLGEEAARLGLVDRAVEPEATLDEAMAMASELAANPAPQLLMIKDLLTRNASETDLRAVQQRELTSLEAAYRSAEHREAVQAFLDKRAPRFR